MRQILTRRRWFGLDYFLAAVLGAVTPFCSCSSIPLFVGFLQARIPVGVTMTFLIASPLINEASLYLFPAVFGWPVTVVYNALGLALAMASGWAIQRAGLDRYVRRDLFKPSRVTALKAEAGDPLMTQVRAWWTDGWSITRQILPYVVFGVAVAAAIHGFVPQNLVERYLSAKTWWSVPTAVLLGAPLYANSVGILPILEALAGKGVALGNLLAFMTGVVAISVPELMMLSRVLKPRLLYAFVAATLASAMVIGYVINALY